MKIRTKLIVGLFIIILATSITEYNQFILSEQIHNISQYHTLMSIPALTILLEIQIEFEKASKGVHGFKLGHIHDQEEYNASKERLLEKIIQYNELTFSKNFAQEYFADSKMQEMMIMSVNNMNDEFYNFDVVATKIFLTDINEKSVELFNLLDKHYVNFGIIIQNSITMETNEKNKQQEKITEIENFTNTFVIISNIGVIFTIFLIITIIGRSISSQIDELRNKTSEISKGNYNLSIEKKNDEFEPLRNDILKMASDIQNYTSQLNHFKKVLDESSDVAITNTDGIITYVNQKFCDISKYSQEELIGQTHNIIKSGYHDTEFYKKMWETITSGKIWHDQIQNKAKDGTIYWNDLVIVPFMDENDKIQEFFSIRRDITERIKLHQEKIKNEKLIAVGHFSSRLAHDLRNPLSIIRVTLENLKLVYKLDAQKQEYFDKIDRSIDRIVHQVDDVLSYVKGEPPELNKVKFSEIISDCFDSLVISDNVEIIVPKNDLELLCDKKQFVIVINNLILNGIQAIHNSGTIEITIEEKSDEIEIHVKDSGIGISKENLEQIFDPLYTTKQSGTGLGLVSVKSIVELHGGTISVTSPPTVFTIVLPKK